MRACPRVRHIFITAGICAVSIFTVVRTGGAVRSETGPAWTITMRRYGTDMAEIERGITIPLEDALSPLPGLRRISSLSENGRSRVFLTFDEKKTFFSRPASGGRYEVIASAVRRVYERLPSDVQRPEIIAADSYSAPVWSAAVIPNTVTPKSVTRNEGNFDIYSFLEKTARPALAGLEGAASVEISGAARREIVISLHSEAAVRLGLSPRDVARAAADNDASLPGGSAALSERLVPVVIDGRAETLRDIAAIPVPLPGGGVVLLGAIADIEEREREADTIARFNGRRAAVISVLSSFSADSAGLSGRIKEAVSRFENMPVSFIVLSDRGAEDAAAFASARDAALQAAVAVALVCACLTWRRRSPSLRRPLVCALFVPFSGLAASALLGLTGRGFDKLTLTALAAGIGSAVDSALLVSERLTDVTSNELPRALRSLAPPLVSGALTTVISLVPLLALPFSASGVTDIAAAISAVTLSALVFSLTLLPKFLVFGEGGAPLATESSPRAAPVSSATPPAGLRPATPRLIPVALSLVLTAAAVIVVCRAGVSVRDETSSDTVYARIEFEGGLPAEIADLRLERWARTVMNNVGIEYVQTGAQSSSGTALIRFNPRSLTQKKVREIVRSSVPEGGFVYIAEAGAGEASWELSVFGDNAETCRALAREAARALSSLPEVTQTLLNFKESGGALTLEPDRAKFASAQSLSFSDTAAQTRGAVFGPVIYKRIDYERGGETDVRIKSAGNKILSKDDLLSINFSAQNGMSARLASLYGAKETTEWTSLRREGRRRCASITLRSAAADPRVIKKRVMNALADTELPPSYSFEFDAEAIEKADALSKSVYSFLLALLFCFIVIAAANESLLLPFAVLSAVPPSLAVPALILVLTGSPPDFASLCAFIAVTGISVNASVLIASELRGASPALIPQIVRKRLPALVSTSATTIASALPFLFLSENSNNVIRTLSLVTATGVAASAIISITLLPSLARLAPRLFSIRSK